MDHAPNIKTDLSHRAILRAYSNINSSTVPGSFITVCNDQVGRLSNVFIERFKHRCSSRSKFWLRNFEFHGLRWVSRTNNQNVDVCIDTCFGNRWCSYCDGVPSWLTNVWFLVPSKYTTDTCRCFIHRSSGIIQGIVIFGAGRRKKWEAIWRARHCKRTILDERIWHGWMKWNYTNIVKLCTPRPIWIEHFIRIRRLSFVQLNLQAIFRGRWRTNTLHKLFS